MTRDHIKAASAELAKAEKALNSMGEAWQRIDFETAKERWAEFLAAIRRSFFKIRRGASGPAKAWFAEVKRETERDALLRYLTFARDEDEHGITEVATTVPPRGIGFVFGMRGGQEGAFVKQVGGGIRLRAIVWNGQTYDVPRTHLKKPIIPIGPFSFGMLALAYYKEVIVKAETFID